MSQCYALRKDSRPCRNYARAGEFTCASHTNFFKDSKEWLEATLWNTDETAYRGICRHMDHALSVGAIRVKPEDIPRRRQHMGYCPAGLAYTILLQHHESMPLGTNPRLLEYAILRFLNTMRQYHEQFAAFESELSSIDTIKLLSPSFVKRSFCLFREGPMDMLERILVEFSVRNQVAHWGYPTNQPFGSLLVWKSLLLNWLDQYGSKLSELSLFDSSCSLNPLGDDMHDYFKTTVIFCRTFAEACEAVWPMWREMEKKKLLEDIRETTDLYKEELMARTWHPDRFMTWCVDLEEKADMETNWA
jgi:hypothetical protein